MSCYVHVISGLGARVWFTAGSTRTFLTLLWQLDTPPKPPIYNGSTIIHNGTYDGMLISRAPGMYFSSCYGSTMYMKVLLSTYDIIASNAVESLSIFVDGDEMGCSVAEPTCQMANFTGNNDLMSNMSETGASSTIGNGFTLESWIYPLPSFHDVAIFSHWNWYVSLSPSGEFSFHYPSLNGSMVCDGPNNQIVFSTWSHIAIVLSISSQPGVIMYKNGEEVARCTPLYDTTKSVSSTTFIIGNALTPNNSINTAWVGYVYDVRHWNVSRSAADIQNNYLQVFSSPLPNTLIGNWWFNETSASSSSSSSSSSLSYSLTYPDHSSLNHPAISRAGNVSLTTQSLVCPYPSAGSGPPSELTDPCASATTCLSCNQRLTNCYWCGFTSVCRTIPIPFPTTPLCGTDNSQFIVAADQNICSQFK